MDSTERERIARRLALRCPICDDRLAVTKDSERSLHHGRECGTCGVVVLFPRVALVKAIKRAGRTSA